MQHEIQWYKVLKNGKLNETIEVSVLHGLKGCTHRTMNLCDGAVDSYQKNNLKPSHSGNYSVQFRAIFDVKTLLKTFAMALDQDLTCQIFPLRWARFPI